MDFLCVKVERVYINRDYVWLHRFHNEGFGASIEVQEDKPSWVAGDIYTMDEISDRLNDMQKVEKQ